LNVKRGQIESFMVGSIATHPKRKGEANKKAGNVLSFLQAK